MIPRLPVRATVAIGLLLILTSQGWSAATPYRREDWRHWLPSPTLPCGTVRDDALERDAREVRRDAGRRCRVRSGVWDDPYTGAVVRGSASVVVQLDHLVPLKWAHDHGGWRWNAERKAEYANDLRYPRHLVTASARANTQKGARGPETWVPTNKDPAVQCQYGESWAVVLVLNALEIPDATREAIRDLVKTCGPFGRNR